MRQRQWLELMVVYDVNLQYHLDKINVVTDALNRKSEAYIIVQLTQQKELLGELIHMGDDNLKDQCIRSVYDISDPADINGRNRSSTERKS